MILVKRWKLKERRKYAINLGIYQLLLQFSVFSKDQYGLHSDQFPGHPDSVNALIPITDNVVIFP